MWNAAPLAYCWIDKAHKNGKLEQNDEMELNSIKFTHFLVNEPTNI